MTEIWLVFQKSGNAAWQLFPYVLMGVLLGELLRYTPIASLLERSCRRQPAISVILAGILGMVSPMCTYGTVPILLRLLRSGVPIAPLATFLSTSSLMNPQLFVMTWGGLGKEMAFARLASVAVFGLVLGALLHFSPASWTVLPVLSPEVRPQSKEPRRFGWSRFLRDSWRTLEFVGFYVVIGILLGAAIEVFVPGRLILAILGGEGWVQVLAASLLGLPLYACGGGTIPLVHSLMEQGMSSGAALAFLLAGPATRVAPLMALATVLRPRSVGAYVLTLVAYSVAAGLLYGARSPLVLLH